jgi:ASC-1-like (ASCH) protein
MNIIVIHFNESFNLSVSVARVAKYDQFRKDFENNPSHTLDYQNHSGHHKVTTL